MAAAMTRTFKEALHKSLQDFSRPSFPTRSTTYLPVGVQPCKRERAVENAISNWLQNQWPVCRRQASLCRGKL